VPAGYPSRNRWNMILPIPGILHLHMATYLKIHNQSCEQFDMWGVAHKTQYHYSTSVSTATKGAYDSALSNLFHEQNYGAQLRKAASGNWFQDAITCEVTSLRYLKFKTILTGP
jgi:hypothetical protein